LDHDNQVRKRGRIRGAASAGPHNQTDLRDHAGVLRVSPENLGVTAQAFHAFLNARASRVNHANDGRAVLGRQVHDTADFSAVHFTKRAALNGKVLSVDVYLAPVHLSVAGHHAVTQRRFSLGVVLLDHQGFQFPEAAFIQQQQDALARRKAAFGMLFINPGLSAS